MKKIYLKLAASIVSILMALTMVVGSAYAWLTLSRSPAVNGIHVTISGGKSIMLAADLCRTVATAEDRTVTVHYPGEFSNTLNFATFDTYDYLKEVSGLSPVSTADGVYWLLPAYDRETGILKGFSEFTVDSTLEYANGTEEKEGNYVYLDFWIVSPGNEYNIRVSMDSQNNTGSYLIELPGVEEAQDGSLQLEAAQGIAESTARIGFLVNQDIADTEGMTAYISSQHYNEQYKSLMGVYQEKGQKPEREYQFTIYEPNGTTHPSETVQDGDYIITKPLSYNLYGNIILEEDISDRLMVQSSNTWRELGDGSQLEQIFQSSITNRENLTADTAASAFYTDYLQGQVGAYVKSGNFYKSTADLYRAAVGSTADAEVIAGMTAGATDDCFITTLAANTPQRVRMYIWLEGQDADCANAHSVKASSFALNIEFSGADQ